MLGGGSIHVLERDCDGATEKYVLYVTARPEILTGRKEPG